MLTRAVEIDAEKKEETPTETPAASKYLEIKELGVKIKLTNATAALDLYYYVKPNDSLQRAFLSSNPLKSTSCSADGIAPPAALIKRSEQEVQADSFYANVPSVSKKIGTNYYYFQGSQAACSEDSAMQAKATEIRRLLVEAKENIEAL
jgi:hypothetical protein